MMPMRVAFVFLATFVSLCSCITSRNMERVVESADLDDIKLELAMHPGLLSKRDAGGATILHRAAEKGRKEVVALLLEEGASPDIRDRMGNTPVQTAAIEGHLDIVRLLFEAGANLNTTNDYGLTPLLNALFNDNREVATFLLRNGADADYKSRQGSPALLIAAQKANLAFLDLLIAHGADMRAKGQFNARVLHAAVTSNQLNVVKFVVSKGAEIEVKDTYGRTPLHEAVINNNHDIVAFLVSKGADFNAKDLNGYSPFKIAQNKGFAEIERIFARVAQVQQKNVLTATNSQPAVHAGQQYRPSKPPASTDGRTDFGQYHALVIGNNAYTNLPVLKSAENDAREIARILRAAYNFQVKLLLNADRRKILLALSELRMGLTARDNLLVYYAGHGWLDREGDEGYWLPIDATPNNPINWVSNSAVTTMLKAMKAKHVLVVADSCYAGKLTRGIHAVNQAPGYLKRMSQKKARSVLSSGGLEPVVDTGGTGRHSVFAWAFINALGENDSIMSGMQLFLKIRRPVMLDSDQTPEYSDIRKAGHDGGDFIFIKIR
jgi:ankyrin repeat protein